jgi:adenine-specific DNA-methyltransferase
LQQFRVKLEPKPKDHSGKWDGRKAGSYQWFETQDSIGYHEEFRKPKIIYPNMTKYLPFYYDESDHFFGNQKCFIITSETESLPYLTAVFNSSLFRCCFRDNFPELLGNTYELSKVFFDKIPIKKPTEGEAALFEKLVATVQFAKRKSLDVPAAFLEELIDACVLELYFPDEALKKDLQFITDTAACLEKTPAALSEKSIREFITHCTARGLDEKLNRLSACDAAQAGTGLFAVIKQEGKV